MSGLNASRDNFVAFYSVAAVTMDVILIFLASVLVIVLSTAALKRKAFVDKVNAIPGPKTNFFVGNLMDVVKHNFGKFVANEVLSSMKMVTLICNKFFIKIGPNESCHI